MKIVDRQDGGAVVELSLEEIELLSSALNEVCNGIRVTPFAEKLGVERDKAEQVLDQFVQLRRKVAQGRSS